MNTEGYRSTEKEHQKAKPQRSAGADLENPAEGLSLEWGARMPHLQEGPGPRLQGKRCFGGSRLQPVENVNHIEFRQRERKLEGYKRPEGMETCVPG